MTRVSGVPAANATGAAGMSRRVIAATVIGTVVEWYDFSVYGFLAVVIAQTFFPAQDPVVGLLQSYVSFAVAYAVRPVAGLLLGRLADRLGRKGALTVTILSMGCATFAIGLVPGYQTIGIAAPVIVLVLRLLQGLGASGEWTIAAAFLMEHSRRSRWGRLGAYLTMSYYVSMLVGTGLASLLASVLSPAEFREWGWRALFVFAAPLVLVGRYIRRRLTESPALRAVLDRERAQQQTRRSLGRVLREQAGPMISFLLASAQQIVAQFALATVVTTGLIRTGLSARAAFFVVFLGYLFSFAVGWASGPLCDRFGAGRLWQFSICYLTVVAVPGFLLIETGRFVPALLGSLLFAVGVVLISAPRTVILIAMLPVAARGAAGGLSYNAGTLLFGATAPLIATALQDVGDTAFAWYLAGLGVVSFVALRFCRRYYREVTA